MRCATLFGTDRVLTRPRRYALAALVLIVFAGMAVRVRLAATPLERDEGEYAYAGQLLLHGVPPYRSAYNLKFPGVYLAYAAFEAVGGQTATAVHLGIAVTVAASTVLVFGLARTAWGTDGAGLAAAGAFAALSLDPNALGLAGHAEHLVLPPVLGGLLVIATLPKDRDAVNRVAWAGALLAVGVLMKQPAAVFAGVGLAAVFVQCRADRRRVLVRSSAFAAGFAAPLLAVAVWLWAAGVFGRFWFWTVDYARSYGAQVPLRGAPYVLGNAVARLTRDSWPVWSLAVIGCVVSMWDRRRRRAALGVAVIGVAALAAVSAGFLYRNHYFILLMPAAAMAVGGLFVGRGRAVAAVALLAAVGWQLVAQSSVLFRLSPEQVNRATYREEAFVEAAAVGRYLRDRAPGDATVAVLGSEPEIYFEARRRSATGYVYTYALLEPQPHAVEMQHEMAAEIESARPAYVVWVHLGNSWFQPQDRSPNTWIFDWWAAYAKGYDLVATVENGAGLAEHQAAGAAARAWTSPGLFVFRRRGRAGGDR
jgi:hypothetical protein